MKLSRHDQSFEPSGASMSDALRAGLICAALCLTLCGCEFPSPHTFSRNYSLRPDLPVDPPGHENTADHDCVEGGRLYKYYCGSCHNARPLGERPFSNYHVAIAHMRDQAYLTGEEYRQIIMFVRRWQELGAPTAPVGPSPKRMTFSQPIAELRKEGAGGDKAPPSEDAGPFKDLGQGAGRANAGENPALPEAGQPRAGDAALPAPIN